MLLWVIPLNLPSTREDVARFPFPDSRALFPLTKAQGLVSRTFPGEQQSPLQPGAGVSLIAAKEVLL